MHTINEQGSPNSDSQVDSSIVSNLSQNLNLPSNFLQNATSQLQSQRSP